MDDAHGAGVIGRTGKGSLEHAKVSRQRIIQTITLSKAFGAYGGAILGPKQLRKKIFEKSSLFIGSTPIPLPLAAAALAGLQIIRRDSSLRKRLLKNINYVRLKLHESGVTLPATPGPIIAIITTSVGECARFSGQLLRAKIFPPLVRYPGGPAGGYFRFVISREHNWEQLHELVKALTRRAGRVRELL